LPVPAELRRAAGPGGTVVAPAPAAPEAAGRARPAWVWGGLLALCGGGAVLVALLLRGC
jgi:hypothetical protein